MDLKDKDDITSISLRWLFKQAAPNAWNLNHVELANLLSTKEDSVKILENGITR